jgi:hypothetical protein
MRPITIKALVFLLLLATVSYGAGGDDLPVIRLENQTYTPLHYRVRTPNGSFTDWNLVLPGETASYEDASLVTEIWYDQDRSETFNIQSGNRYLYYRTHPKGAPEIASWDGDDARLPRPPGTPVAGDGPFGALERFIADCRLHKQTYRLSLKKLAADCARAQQHGALPTELRYLHGFTWFFGYFVDDANQDVILLGVKDPTRPPLDLDCLVTAVKAAYSGSEPRCSLDQHDDPKTQKCVVEGVPWNTLWALIIILADYDMKRLCQGHWQPNISGFRSHTRHFDEILSIRGFDESEGWFDTQGRKHTLDRWWFNFNSQVPRTVADDSGKLVYLYKNPVRVSTERVVNGTFGSGQTTPSATQFAADFTTHMESLAKRYSNIAQLCALFRLYDLMRHLREVSQTVPPQMAYWATQYQHPYQGPPASMPTLSITRQVQERIGLAHQTQNWTCKGGVEMRLGMTRTSLVRAKLPGNLGP